MMERWVVIHVPIYTIGQTSDLATDIFATDDLLLNVYPEAVYLSIF